MCAKKFVSNEIQKKTFLIKNLFFNFGYSFNFMRFCSRFALFLKLLYVFHFFFNYNGSQSSNAQNKWVRMPDWMTSKWEKLVSYGKNCLFHGFLAFKKHKLTGSKAMQEVEKCKKKFFFKLNLKKTFLIVKIIS